MCKKKNTN